MTLEALQQRSAENIAAEWKAASSGQELVNGSVGSTTIKTVKTGTAFRVTVSQAGAAREVAPMATDKMDEAQRLKAEANRELGQALARRDRGEGGAITAQRQALAKQREGLKLQRQALAEQRRRLNEGAKSKKPAGRKGKRER